MGSVNLTWFGAIALALACSASHATDVYRWMDDTGKVHYADKVPDEYLARSQKVDPNQVGVVPAVRLQSSMASPAPAVTAARTAPAASVPVVASAPNACGEQWRQYNASAACFAPFRIRGGGVKPEAYQRCTELPQPQCAPYPGN